MAKRVAPKEIPKLLRVEPGSRVHLTDANAQRVYGWEEDAAEELLKDNRKKLEALQYELFADGRFAVLIVLQAIDGGGKDSTIRHVMRAFNPQGCTVTSFKAPTTEELKHDFLWRVHKRVPPRGEVGVFNRSHYEDVLVARVMNLVPKEIWQRRYTQINVFEQILTAGNMHVIKLFLQISKDEQKRRFEERLNEPHKQWKFNPQDLVTRKSWNEYVKAYEAALSRCSTSSAPWYLIPSDHKWFRNLAVSQILLQHLEALPLRFPKLEYDPQEIRIR